VLDDADLHRHDFKLLPDLLANGVLAAAKYARQFMLKKFVDDFNARQMRATACVCRAAWRVKPLFADSSTGSTSCSASLNDTICGAAGSTACSDCRPNSRWRSRATVLQESQLWIASSQAFA